MGEKIVGGNGQRLPGLARGNCRGRRPIIGQSVARLSVGQPQASRLRQFQPWKKQSRPVCRAAFLSGGDDGQEGRARGNNPGLRPCLQAAGSAGTAGNFSDLKNAA